MLQEALVNMFAKERDAAQDGMSHCWFSK
jgi:hypothetical protein